MRELRFYKESSGNRYVDLPDWKDDKDKLLMGRIRVRPDTENDGRPVR